MLSRIHYFAHFLQNNLVEALFEHSKALDAKLERYEAVEKEKQDKIQEYKETLQGLRSRRKQIDDEYEELSEKKADDKSSYEIQALLATYERLKADEKQFKEMCHEELELLQAMSAQAGKT